jgi:aspartate 1-decarboxylase
MPKRTLDRIRKAVRLGEYDVTKHAVDEMAEDALDIVDIETAILNGIIVKTEKDDPRGTRYTIHGTAADGVTLTGLAGRFTETGRYVIITAYKVTDE